MDRSVFLAAGAALQTLREILRLPWVHLRVGAKGAAVFGFSSKRQAYSTWQHFVDLPMFAPASTAVEMLAPLSCTQHLQHIGFDLLSWVTRHPDGQEAACAALAAMDAAWLMAAAAMHAEQTDSRQSFMLQASTDGIFWGPFVAFDGRTSRVIAPIDVAVIDPNGWAIHRMQLPDARVSSALGRFTRVIQSRLKADLQHLGHGLEPMVAHSVTLSMDLAQNRLVCPWIAPNSLLEHVVWAHLRVAEERERVRASQWTDISDLLKFRQRDVPSHVFQLCVVRRSNAVMLWLQRSRVDLPPHTFVCYDINTLFLRLCAPLDTDSL